MSGSEFLSKHIATQSSDGTKQYAYDTSGLNDLVNTFNVIAGSIGDLFTVQPKKIVDVIDARFKLTNDGLNDLATNRRLGTGKINSNEDGSKEIIWTDSTTDSEVGKVTIVDIDDGTLKLPGQNRRPELEIQPQRTRMTKVGMQVSGFRRKTTSLVET